MTNQSQLLQHIKAHPGQTRAELIENFGDNPWNTQSALQDLLIADLVYRKLLRGQPAEYFATPDREVA